MFCTTIVLFRFFSRSSDASLRFMSSVGFGRSSFRALRGFLPMFSFRSVMLMVRRGLEGDEPCFMRSSFSFILSRSSSSFFFAFSAYSSLSHFFRKSVSDARDAPYAPPALAILDVVSKVSVRDEVSRAVSAHEKAGGRYGRSSAPVRHRLAA